MSVRIGDSAFTRDGSPALVTKSHPESGRVSLERNIDQVQKSTRHGYINGLTPAAREDLYAILDQAKGEGDPRQRLQVLQDKVAELEADPSKHNLTRYLRSEMVFIMNNFNIKPKVFSVDEMAIR